MSMIGNFRLATDAEVAALLKKPATIEAILYSDEKGDPDKQTDVDKAWQAIHFLLTGTAWEGKAPLNFVVSGGTPVGDVDVGYGPARVFTSREVAEIARALEPLTPEVLKERFDAEALQRNDIYPEIWDEPEEECLDAYVLEHYAGLREFLKGAAAAGSALIVYLN